VPIDFVFTQSAQWIALLALGRSVDSAWEPQKLEARKMPENAAESPC
jgi:hypothetical protein